MSVSNVKFVDFPREYKKYKKEIDSAIRRVLDSGKFILQEEVDDFEKTLAGFLGTRYAVGVNSGTDALFLSLKLAGIGRGDEVITVGHTFHATVEAIHWNGATPILVDVDGTSQMDVWEVEKKITPKTKAIIPVHLMGDMVNMKELKKIAGNIPIIEDSAQALGADWNGKRAGSWGLFGCFSFYPAKILGGLGDGGAITTNNRLYAEELKNMRNHYKYSPGKWGFNSRLDNLQAAVLKVKLNHIDEILENRQHVAERYLEAFRDLPFKSPTDRPGRVWQDFIIRTDRRDELADYLRKRGIQTMKNDYHFPMPKPKATIKLESETLRLPCNDVLKPGQVNEVIKNVQKFYTK